MRVFSPGAVDTRAVYSRSAPTVGPRDRDRALHAGVLTHGRVPVGGGDARGHRPMIGRYHPAMSVPAPEIPRFRLFDAPSPLAPLPRLSAALGGRAEIWVKREDLLPLAFGGNKLRNLEFLVGAALAEGADTLVTSGRRWSNHCRLTAAAGATAGLAVELVLSGPPASVPGPGVRLMQAFGATVHQLPTRGPGRTGGGGGAGHAARSSSGAAGRTSSMSGARACSGRTASRSRVTSCSTRPTAAGPRPWTASSCRRLRAGRRPGLIVAAASRSPATRVAGVVVARPASELRPAIATRWSAAWTRTAPFAVDPDEAIDLDERQLGDGYGRPTAAAAARPQTCWPGPRGSWSIRSTRPRRWRAWSPAFAAAPWTGSASCSGTPAACPGSSNRSTDAAAGGAEPSLPG